MDDLIIIGTVSAFIAVIFFGGAARHTIILAQRNKSRLQ